MAEEDHILHRVRRYAQVSTKLPGLIARFAGGQYFDIDRQKHAQDLKAALGDLKGPLMKVAQMLSTIPDALPAEYTQELGGLQANAPPMGWPFVKRRMQAELGPDWQSRFQSFDHQAAAAASLGQVHKAIALDGTVLACKLQYPQMTSTVEADLKQLKLILSVYESFDRAIHTKNIHREIAERLREELDYLLEAKHIRLYQEMMKGLEKVHVPEYYPDLSSPRLLTMSWLEGRPLREVIDRPESDRNEIAKTMFHAWYKPLYVYGIIHGDPHLGNYSFRADNSVNLMDFGCVRIFHATFIQGVIDLYYALLEGDEERAVHAYQTWGFNNLSKELIEILNGWANFLYGPVMDNRVRLIDETESGFYGREIAGQVHQALRNVGGVEPPAEFVFMDRAAIGLGSVFLHLRAKINWYEEFNRLIEDFDAKLLDERQEKLLHQTGLR